MLEDPHIEDVGIHLAVPIFRHLHCVDLSCVDQRSLALAEG